MLAKSLQSVLRVTLSYALYNKAHASHISTTRIGNQVVQRRFSYRNNLSSDLCLQVRTINNRYYCCIRHRVSSQSTGVSVKMLNYLPFFLSGNIVSGFGRGSKELGIPTANYPLDVVKSLPDCFKTGVYYGWANINNGSVYKMVMSIGWNPFYDNKEKSIETHILHDFNRDLYGCLLKVCIVGYLRPEQNFKSLEDLITCIKDDIRQAEELLESNKSYKQLENHSFFQENIDDTTK